MSLSNVIIYVCNLEWQCFSFKTFIKYEINVYVSEFSFPLEAMRVVKQE